MSRLVARLVACLWRLWRPALAISLIASVGACATEEPIAATSVLERPSLAFTREHVTADIYHYEVTVPIGTSANAKLRLHRVVRETAPYQPAPTTRAAMLLHGDFSTFATNFAPSLGTPASSVTGLAPYLAAAGVDVWGVDRRWTLPGTTDDISDFGTMGVAQEIRDLRIALALARGARGSADRFALIGFSHGAQLAYAYAAVEGGRPAPTRHVDALVPLDWYGAYPPEATALQQASCEAATLYPYVEDGWIDSPNDFLIRMGTLARSAPGGTDFPTLAPWTNLDVLRSFLGMTWDWGATYAPFYHLAAPVIEDGMVVAFRESTDDAMSAWLAGATPHQAILESLDFDALLCPTAPQPVDAPLANIAVPVFYVGAAGGVGDDGLYATTQVGSSDVTTVVIRRFAPDRRVDDFGHTDLLLATDAPSLVFQPIADWLMHH